MTLLELNVVFEDLVQVCFEILHHQADVTQVAHVWLEVITVQI